jgi:hypothetical protein
MAEYSARFQFRDSLPDDDLTYKYRARHTGRGVTAGAWTDTISGKPTLLPTGEIPTPPIGKVGIDVDLQLRAVTGPALTKSGGLVSNVQTGAAGDAGAVSFGSTFSGTPSVWFVPEGAMTYSTALSGRQTADIRATDLTATGFTMRAKLMSAASGTLSTDYWSTALNSAESSNQDISTHNAKVYSSLSAATTVNTEYTAIYSIDGSSMDGAVLATVKLYKNAGAASTAWTLVNSRTHDTTTANNQESYTAISTSINEVSMTTGPADGVRWFAAEAP